MFCHKQRMQPGIFILARFCSVAAETVGCLTISCSRMMHTKLDCSAMAVQNSYRSALTTIGTADLVGSPGFHSH